MLCFFHAVFSVWKRWEHQGTQRRLQRHGEVRAFGVRLFVVTLLVTTDLAFDESSWQSRSSVSMLVTIPLYIEISNIHYRNIIADCN
jgi:hypothetical protein